MDSPSGLPRLGSPSGLQAPSTLDPGPSLGISRSRRKRVAFAIDEDDNDDTDPPAPSSKHVAYSTAPASLFGDGRVI